MFLDMEQRLNAITYCTSQVTENVTDPSREKSSFPTLRLHAGVTTVAPLFEFLLTFAREFLIVWIVSNCWCGS